MRQRKLISMDDRGSVCDLSQFAPVSRPQLANQFSKHSNIQYKQDQVFQKGPRDDPQIWETGIFVYLAYFEGFFQSISRQCFTSLERYGCLPPLFKLCTPSSDFLSRSKEVIKLVIICNINDFHQLFKESNHPLSHFTLLPPLSPLLPLLLWKWPRFVYSDAVHR